LPFEHEHREEAVARETPGVAAPADFREIRDRLERAVHRVCPAWLRASAEDIVQNALLRVLEIEKTRESSTPLPSSYLWKVAYSATVDEIRRLRRRPEVAWDAADPERADPPEPGGTGGRPVAPGVGTSHGGLPQGASGRPPRGGRVSLAGIPGR
jgi:DNA-directed RNA polymerase specialized sigma24 family protein